MPRILILTEGKTNPTDAKTATGVIRYRPEAVAGILDSTLAGKTCGEVLGVGGDLPVVGSIGDVDADTLLIGIAPSGGRLPESWRRVVREAIERGMEIVSGLHTFLGNDPEFAALARKHGVAIHDVRRPPADLTVSKNAARLSPTFRVHTVGHDCSVGKMLVALEIDRALRNRGRSSRFIASGQTGIMIAGSGVAVDAVVSDFVAGAIEREVLANEDADFLLVEGQGSLIHPMYSGVTLGLLHGCAPQAMVMCLDATRTEVRHCDMPMVSTEIVIDLYERLARVLVPSSRVIGIAINTSRLSEARAEEELERTHQSTGLPVTDVIRYGSEPLVAAVLAAEEEWKHEGARRESKS